MATKFTLKNLIWEANLRRMCDDRICKHLRWSGSAHTPELPGAVRNGGLAESHPISVLTI
jgi:hypothetical protein